MRLLKIPKQKKQKTSRGTFGWLNRNRVKALLLLLVMVISVVAFVLPDPKAKASTIRLDPNGDVTTQWTPSTGTTHYTLVDDGATDNTADYVQVLSTNTTTGLVDEWALSTIGGTGYGASQIDVRIYMESTTVQSTADTISLAARINGTLQSAQTCTPTLNSWTACTVTYTGTYSPSDIDSLQIQILRNVNGTGPSSSRPDTMLVANSYATVTYNASPNAPTLSAPTSGATGVAVSPVFTFSTTDAESDYLRYKLFLYQSDCSTSVTTADETSSQTGWSGQNTQTSTAYTSGSTATYTYTGTLSAGTTYCWQVQAIDPAGSNSWGSLSATQSFTINNAPGTPTLSAPTSGATGVSLTPAFTFSATDAESDYLRYQLVLYQSDCSTVVVSADENSSQTGWSGQNTQTSTAYTSGSTATYTYQGTLSAGTTYCWKAQAKDPGGSNTFGSFSATRSFTTNAAPGTPTLSAPTSGATGVATSPAFTFSATDADGNTLKYKLILYQSDCSTVVATADMTSDTTGWSNTSYASGATASYTYTGTLFASTTYCWQAQAIDQGGSNTWGSLSGTRSFTTNSGATMVNWGGNLTIRGGTRFGN